MRKATPPSFQIQTCILRSLVPESAQTWPHRTPFQIPRCSNPACRRLSSLPDERCKVMLVFTRRAEPTRRSAIFEAKKKTTVNQRFQTRDNPSANADPRDRDKRKPATGTAFWRVKGTQQPFFSSYKEENSFTTFLSTGLIFLEPWSAPGRSYRCEHLCSQPAGGDQMRTERGPQHTAPVAALQTRHACVFSLKHEGEETWEPAKQITTWGNSSFQAHLAWSICDGEPDSSWASLHSSQASPRRVFPWNAKLKRRNQVRCCCQ